MVNKFLRDLSRRKFDFLHSMMMSHSLYNQQKKGKFCDMKIVVEDREYLVHRCVIATASAELEEQIDEMDTIKLVGVTKYGFEKALEVLYTGKISKVATIDATRFRQIVGAADALNAESVINYCTRERGDLMARILGQTSEGRSEQNRHMVPVPYGCAASSTETRISLADPMLSNDQGMSSRDSVIEIASDSDTRKDRRDSAESLYESIAADVEIGPGFRALSAADEALTPEELEDLLDRPIPDHLLDDTDDMEPDTEQVMDKKESKKTKCSICGQMCPNSSSIKLHLRKHTSFISGMRPHRCDACGMTFSYRITLMSHMKLHQMKRFICRTCGKDFKVSRNLQYHIENSHGGDLGYSTQHDSVSRSSMLVSQESERDRMRDLVLGIEPDSDGVFTCPICDKGFVKRWNLKCHVLKHKECFKDADDASLQDSASPSYKRKYGEFYHNSERNYECPKCSAAFTTATGLKKHTTFMHTRNNAVVQVKAIANKPIVSSEKPNVCEKCHKSFATENGLRKHVTHMHTKREYTFGPAYNPKRPRKSEPLSAGAFAEVTCWCKVCGKGFKRQRNLRSHMETHTGAGYECPICGRKFSQKDGLNGHLWIHGGVNGRKMIKGPKETSDNATQESGVDVTSSQQSDTVEVSNNVQVVGQNDKEGNV